MLQREHSAILSTFIKLPTFVLSIFERPFYTGFTVLTLKAKIVIFEINFLLLYSPLHANSMDAP